MKRDSPPIDEVVVSWTIDIFHFSWTISNLDLLYVEAIARPMAIVNQPSANHGDFNIFSSNNSVAKSSNGIEFV